MSFKSHIPKPIKMILLSFLMAIAISIPMAIQTCTVYADSISSAASAIAGRVSAYYNGTSDSNRGGNTAIVNGVSYTRTGYLCYMLTKDGSTTGLPAYAFSSPGFSAISGSKWVCTSRRGQSVSGWTATAPWNVTPWENGGSPSNEPQIREWALNVEVDGKPNAQQFVFKTWGVEAEKNFQSDEYILVIETIMNFQYSVKGGSGGGGGASSVDDDALYKACYTEAENEVDSWDTATLRFILQYDENLSSKDDIIDEVAGRAFNIAKSQLSGGSGRTFTSDPLIGTVPNLITYKGTSTVFDSYTNKVAPHAEKIKVSEAGFTAYTANGNSLSDSEVQTYRVAMLIIHCKNDSIHTYWEPNHSLF